MSYHSFRTYTLILHGKTVYLSALTFFLLGKSVQVKDRQFAYQIDLNHETNINSKVTYMSFDDGLSLKNLQVQERDIVLLKCVSYLKIVFYRTRVIGLKSITRDMLICPKLLNKR